MRLIPKPELNAIPQNVLRLNHVLRLIPKPELNAIPQNLNPNPEQVKAALKSEEILDEQRLRESEQALELINTHTHTHCSPATLHADPSP